MKTVAKKEKKMTSDCLSFAISLALVTLLLPGQSNLHRLLLLHNAVNASGTSVALMI